MNVLFESRRTIITMNYCKFSDMHWQHKKYPLRIFGQLLFPSSGENEEGQSNCPKICDEYFFCCQYMSYSFMISETLSLSVRTYFGLMRILCQGIFFEKMLNLEKEKNPQFFLPHQQRDKYNLPTARSVPDFSAVGWIRVKSMNNS